MSSGRLSMIELTPIYNVEDKVPRQNIHHELWPLGDIDPKNAKFPCCLVWAPLPVVSWLAPFIGHVGICREDGVVLDFSGSNPVNVDNFAFAPVARYIQLDRKYDDALHSNMRQFEHRSYNLFTCNCHSFAANCVNRLSYGGGSMEWNMINVAALILFKGQWIDWYSALRSFLPFVIVMCLGIVMVGWPFLIGMLSFSLLLLGWFLMETPPFGSSPAPMIYVKLARFQSFPFFNSKEWLTPTSQVI
ncbi:hypothetical protein M9H77_16931 [Catharanthus roseus]|uniref:Uncharacterized protein n=1 Tax=Catharanthus roseus TaxID=4058 RepID=A0ACC0B372_CATRO|nr:hypothetical protein M9H77_16931 [Catharanthus roseus]